MTAPTTPGINASGDEGRTLTATDCLTRDTSAGGWYVDPAGVIRWWDGYGWSTSTRTAARNPAIESALPCSQLCPVVLAHSDTAAAP